MLVISLPESRKGVNPKGPEVETSMVKTSTSFGVGALLVIGLIIALYSVYW